MSILQAVILGIIEGITEFLPISSTFHLILSGQLLGVPQNDFTKVFEVIIQSGAILSVVFLYWRMLLHDKMLFLKVIISFIPTAAIGLLLHKVIKNVFFESNLLMLSVFFIVGIMFIWVENRIKHQQLTIDKEINGLNFTQAILIGVAQALAVIPGVSRAGAVIIAMMLLGFRRDESARFSFLLAVPTIFAASALDAFQMRDTILSNSTNIYILVVGFIAALISSMVIIKWFIGFLQRKSLVPFALYRFIAAVLFLIFLLK